MPEDPAQVSHAVVGKCIQQFLLELQNLRIAFYVGPNGGDRNGAKMLHNYRNHALGAVQFGDGRVNALQGLGSGLDGLLDGAFKFGERVSPIFSSSGWAKQGSNLGERNS